MALYHLSMKPIWGCKPKPPKIPPAVEVADQVVVIVIGIAMFSRAKNS